MARRSFWTALMNLFFPSVGTDTHTVFITFSAIMAAHLLLNLNGVRLLAAINSISAWWHMVGVLVIVAVLAIVPDHHQSFSFVFCEDAQRVGLQRPQLHHAGLLVRVRDRAADGAVHVYGL